MDPITRGTSGARFVKADLHLHTPASDDFQDEITPDEYVAKACDEDLELIAVTDHNRAGWYEELRDAAEGTQLEVLPGVEITSPQGGDNQIHVTAIFPPENHNQVNYVLGQIGINPEATVDEQADARIKEIANKVADNGGLPILAHIDNPSGAHHETSSGQIRDEIFDAQSIAAIEFKEDRLESYYPDFPAIRSSDAHSLGQIGQRFTYLKMTDPSFDGLRTALADPESRITFEEPDKSHARILGVRGNGAFLTDRAVQLNPGLNTLIGGKGTGKSTLIEYVRYAFDISPRTERIEQDYLELIGETLGEGGHVEVQVVTEDGQKYAIEREFEEEPVIKREDGTEVDMAIETFREEFFNLEIHSQHELLELARDTRDQLQLIDSYLNFEGAKSSRKDLKTQLRDNATQLQARREEASNLKDDLRNLKALREKITVMEEQGVDEYLEGQGLWEEEKRRLDRFHSTVEEAVEELDSLVGFEDPSDEEIEEVSPNQDIIQQARDIVTEAHETYQSRIEELRSELIDAAEEIDSAIETWESRQEDRREEFQELKDEIESETEVDVEEYFDLKDQVNQLEGTEEELEETEVAIADLEDERSELLTELNEVRQEITEIRRRGIEDISESLSSVRVRLEPESDRTEYQDWFNRVLRGSRVYTEDKERVTELFDPQELTDIIRERDTERLIDEADLSPTGAENMVEYDELRNQLHILEIQEIHDKPIIEILEEGDWKPLNRMSDGQKATALLSIATLEREMPLIVDQPEDQLDNEFIFDVVVDVIRRVKESRQIIMPTHNANIPILGDAEQILVMWSDGHNGYIQERGSIDRPVIRERAQNILEGGQEAFSMRTEKYGTEFATTQ